MSFADGIGDSQVTAATSKTTGTLSAAPSQNDLILLFVYTQNGSGGSRTYTWPSGFTELYNVDINSNHTLAAAYKIAGASESTSYTYSWTGTSYAQDDYLAVYDTVNTSAPIGTSPASSYNSYGSSHTVNSITTGTNGETAFHAAAGEAAMSGDITPPTGWTERYDGTNLYVCDQVINPAGSAGGETMSHNGAYNASATFAIEPAGAASAPIGAFNWKPSYQSYMQIYPSYP